MKFQKLFALTFILFFVSGALAGGETCGEALEELPVDMIPSSVASFLDSQEQFEAARLELLGTNFLVVTRRNGGPGKIRIAKAICLAWPKWRQLFFNKIEQVSIIHSDQLLGGGPIGPNILGIHLGGAVPGKVAPFIESMFGWQSQPTATDYVLKYYENFEDPIQAYITDIVTHEFGHLFFGWGLTQLSEDSERWFALGLGLVYDRSIWNQISSQPSPLFTATLTVWQEKFSRIPQIDQRLINPDTKHDPDYLLVRDQTYNHGKSLAYLNELRNRLGSRRFDELVQSYLSRPYGSKIGYDDFLTKLTTEELEVVKIAEKEFTIR